MEDEEEGAHMHGGVKRAVYDVLGGGWVSWWSCCGRVKGEGGWVEEAFVG